MIQCGAMRILILRPTDRMDLMLTNCNPVADFDRTVGFGKK
jgi:hypothetical protein